MAHEYVGRIEGVELENYRSIAAKRDAVETNPRAFAKEETVEAFEDYYRTVALVVDNHPEWELDSFPHFNVSPDSGCVYGSDEMP